MGFCFFESIVIKYFIPFGVAMVCSFFELMEEVSEENYQEASIRLFG